MVLPNFIQQVRSAIDHEFKRSLYRNLVFSGGGVRGIVYLGALELLDQFRIVDNIERVAGTSAGAITAAMLSFRLSIRKQKINSSALILQKFPK